MYCKAREFGLLTFALEGVEKHVKACEEYEPRHEGEIKRYRSLLDYINNKLISFYNDKDSLVTQYHYGENNKLIMTKITHMICDCVLCEVDRKSKNE